MHTTTLALKRIFDIFFSASGLLILLPVFLVIALVIKLDSSGPVFFRQSRVGRDNKDFNLWKFRTMVRDAHLKGLITIGGRDPRVTQAGFYLRKFKLDELPQLINVLIGDMSFVGPRPEVRKYVDQYDREQKKILCIRPGITDYASLKYSRENEILENVEDPEAYYEEVLIPEKITLARKYIDDLSLWTDLRIIYMTFIKILK